MQVEALPKPKEGESLMHIKKEGVMEPLISYGVFLSSLKKSLERQSEKRENDQKIQAKLELIVHLDNKFSDAMDEMAKALDNWEQ